MKLNFVGDILIANSCFDIGFGPLEKANKVGSANFIREAATAFIDADISVGNLEFVISDYTAKYGTKAKEFRAPTSFLEDIKELGVDIFSVANNHIMQHGIEGFINTVNNLTSIDKKIIGLCENPYEIIEYDNKKIGIIGASTKFDPFVVNAKDYYLNIYPDIPVSKKQYDLLVTMLSKNEIELIESVYTLTNNYYIPNIAKIRSNLNDEVLFCEILMKAYCNDIINNQLFTEIKQLKKETDFIIAYLHWGDEYIHMPANWQTVLGRKLVDLGCNLIVGCHSHTIQGMEVYNNAPIFYSLGNYFFNSNNPAAKESIVLSTEIQHKDKSLELANFSIIPYIYDQKLYHPIKLESESKEEVKIRFKEYSDLLGKLKMEDYQSELQKGIGISRKYKRLHVLQNIHRMNFREIISIGTDYFKRILKRVFRS